MRGPVEETGATVDEAIEAALARLGATEDEVEIRILSEGARFPGSTEQARVLVKMRDERGPEDFHDEGEGDPEEEAQPEPVAPEALREQADAAADFLDELLEIMDVDADLDVSIGHDGALVELGGDEVGLLIGRHGATLEALQDVTRAAVKNRLGDWPRLGLDAEGYYARRRESLEHRARSLAEKVRRTGKSVALSPMSATERKIVHETVAGVSGVETESAGEGLDRHVVIYPA